MIIGIFGQMHNGKTTLAKKLLYHMNDAIRMRMTELQIPNVFQINSFAKAVKEMVCKKYDITMGIIEEWKNKDEKYPGWNCTMRECLQREGNQAREVYPSVWIDKIISNPYPMIIDDGRYENEANAIANRKGYNILIVREGYVNDSQHPSEKWIGDIVRNGCDIPNIFHHVVVNNGLSGALDNTAIDMVKPILAHYRKHHAI